MLFNLEFLAWEMYEWCEREWIWFDFHGWVDCNCGALGDHSSCKISCTIPLCLLPSSHGTAFCLPKNVDLMILVKSSEANWKIWTQSMQYFIVASLWSKYIIWYEVFLQFLEVRRKELWREFFLHPLPWWDQRPEKVTKHQSHHSSHVTCVNLVCAF